MTKGSPENIELELGFTSHPEAAFYQVPEPKKQQSKLYAIDLSCADSFPSLGAPKSTRSNKPVVTKQWAQPTSTIQEVIDLPAEMQARRPFDSGGPVSFAALKEIKDRTNTDIDLSISKRNGTMSFVVRGKPEAIKQARREIHAKFAADRRCEMLIPVSCRPHIVGSGGKTLKAVIEKSGAKIDIRRLSDKELATLPANAGLPESEYVQPIEIRGDNEAVSIAKQEIESIITQRTSRAASKITVERSFLPLMSDQIAAYTKEYGVRIHTPPMVTFGKDDTHTSSEVTVTVVGDNAAARTVAQKLQELVHYLKMSTASLVVTVRKKAHRFVVGPKGSNMTRILQLTGCALDLPPSNDSSEQIVLRGPENKIPEALRLVLEAASSVTFETLPLNFLPVSCNPKLLVIYVSVRHRSQIRSIEQTHNVTVAFPENYTEKPLADKPTAVLSFEIQGSDVDRTAQAVRELKAWLKSITDTEYFALLKLRKRLVKYVVGKQGNNLQKFRADERYADGLADILIGPFHSQNEIPASDTSSDENGFDDADDSKEEDGVLVCKRQAFRNQKDADVFVASVWAEVTKDAELSLNTTSLTIPVEAAYRPRLTAKAGDLTAPFYKTLLDPLQVSSRYLFKEGKLLINGKDEDVEKAKELVEKTFKQWKTSKQVFSVKVPVSAAACKKLFGVQQGDVPLSNLFWLYRQARALIEDGLWKGKAANVDLESPSLNCVVSIAPETGDVCVSGSEQLVELLVGLIEARAEFIELAEEESLNLLEQVLEHMNVKTFDNTEQLDRAFRRAVGKEFRNVRRIQGVHNVRIDFPSSSSDDSAGDKWTRVALKGLPKSLDVARKELVELFVDEISKSYRETLKVPKRVIPSLVGKGGVRFKELKSQYPCSIEFTPSSDPETEIAIIEGRQKDVESVAKVLSAQIELFISTQTDVLEIPQRLHAAILGGNRDVMKKLSGEHNAHVQFNDNGTVSITAPLESMPVAKSQIFELLGKLFSVPDEFSGTVFTRECVLPRRDVPRIIGKAGKALRDLQTKYHVHVRIDNDSTSDMVPVFAYGASQAAVDDAIADIVARERAFKHFALPKALSDRYASEVPEVHEAENARIADLLRQNAALDGLFFEVSTQSASGAPGVTALGNKTALDQHSSAIQTLVDSIEPVTYVHKIAVPSYVLPHLIGRSGSRLKQFKDDHGAIVTVVRASGPRGSLLESDVCLLRPVNSSNSDNLEAALGVVNRIIAEQQELYELEQEEKAASTVRAEEAKRAIRNEPLGKRVVPGYSSNLRSNVRRDRGYGIAAASLHGDGSSFGYSTSDTNGAQKWRVVGNGKKALNVQSSEPSKGGVADDNSMSVLANVEGGSISSKKKNKKKH